MHYNGFYFSTFILIDLIITNCNLVKSSTNNQFIFERYIITFSHQPAITIKKAWLPTFGATPIILSAKPNFEVLQPC